MKKRILSLVLTLTMLASIYAFMPLNVSAKTNGYTQEKAVKYIESMIGTKYDVSPKNNSYDCVDLANEYYHVVGGQDYKARGNGGDFCTNALPSGWNRNYISDGYTPQAGDVVSWAAVGGWGPYGHVALVLSVSSSNKTITVVEQSTSRQISASKATYKWSSPTCYIHPDFVPSTPTIKSKTDVASTSVKLSWNSVSGATKYKLEYRKAGDSWDNDAISKTTSDTSYPVKDLEAGKLYWFRLYAGNDAGWSGKSENYGVYLKPNKPVARKTGSPGSIKLEWSSAGGNTKYEIQVRKSGDETADPDLTVMLQNAYTHTFTGLTPGAQYYFKVKEYNVDNPAVVSGLSNAGTNFTKLSKPTATEITPNSVSLSWKRDKMDSAYTYTYIVRRGPANAGGPENALNSYYNITDLLSGSSYQDTNVSQGTSYDYYIDVYRTKDGQTEWCEIIKQEDKTMEVILIKDVENLGYANDIVNVKPGYANNYLIPQGYAKAATASAKKILAENLKQRAHKDAKILADAQALAETISNLTLTISAKAEEGKLFGTVTATDLSEALAAKGITVDRKAIVVDAVKTVGEYVAVAKLHREVKAEVKFAVVAAEE